MENSGDKFASLVIPNCQRTASQEEKLQSCYFARESKVLPPDDIQIQSSSSPENPTGIEMVSLPDSCDEYQTPPEQPYSQNSSNDGQVAATKTAAFDNEQRIVDLANESDNLDTEPMNVDDRLDVTDAAKSVTEVIETEVIRSPEESAHQVFVEMPQSEQETGNREKRKLPLLMKAQKQKSNYSNKHEAFKDSLNRVLKMVEIRKVGGDESEDEDDDIDFMEIAKMRGLTLPRPRWWPAQGFND